MTICAWYVQYFVALGAGLGHWGPKMVQLEMKIISTWRLRGTWGPKMVQVEMKIISTWRLPGPLGPKNGTSGDENHLHLALAWPTGAVKLYERR